jgi:hypothetical protein
MIYHPGNQARYDRGQIPVVTLPAIKLRPQTLAALREYNRQTCGRGVADLAVSDPQVIAHFEAIAIPGEDLDDTILRVLRGAASDKVH